MLLTDAVEWDPDGVAGGPNAGVNEQAERHHPQSQDGGAGGHADAAERKKTTTRSTLHTTAGRDVRLIYRVLFTLFKCWIYLLTN